MSSVALENAHGNKFRIEKIEEIRHNRTRKHYKIKEKTTMENCIFCKIANGEIP